MSDVVLLRKQAKVVGILCKHCLLQSQGGRSLIRAKLHPRSHPQLAPFSLRQFSQNQKLRTLNSIARWSNIVNLIYFDLKCIINSIQCLSNIFSILRMINAAGKCSLVGFKCFSGNMKCLHPSSICQKHKHLSSISHPSSVLQAYVSSTRILQRIVKNMFVLLLYTIPPLLLQSEN